MSPELGYREIQTSKEEFDKLRSNRQFAKLLNLARVVNTLYFCFNAFLDYSDDSSPAGRRQYINASLFSAAVLFEGLTVADTLEKHFGHRDSYREGFGKFLAEDETKQLRSNVLRKMRKSLSSTMTKM